MISDTIQKALINSFFGQNLTIHIGGDRAIKTLVTEDFEDVDLYAECA